MSKIKPQNNTINISVSEPPVSKNYATPKQNYTQYRRTSMLTDSVNQRGVNWQNTGDVRTANFSSITASQTGGMVVHTFQRRRDKFSWKDY